ncbi:MAG: GTPase HflX, partial [gamma proteobacterium symbiont of Ctena orbiculata]
LLANAAPRIERDSEGQIRRIWLSAITGDGTDLLLEALAEFFRKNHVKQRLRLNPGDGRLHALLFERGSVLNESSTEEGGWEMDIDMSEREFLRLLKEEPVLQDCIIG